MTTTRPLGRPFATVLISLTVAACSASATPTGPSGVMPASASPVAGAPSTEATASPTADSTAAPSQAPDPITSPDPSDNASPTNPPDPTATPRPSPIPGCGTGDAGFIAHHLEAPTTLQFGGATIEFTGAGTYMRDGSGGGDDVIPGGIGLTPNEIAVVVGPGGHIILRAASAALLDTTTRAVPWSKVSFEGGLASLAGDQILLDWRVRTDGSLSISAPSTVGDWAVELLPHWQGMCLYGDGTAYARIKVR